MVEKAGRKQLRWPYQPGMDALIACVVAGMAPTALRTTLRVAEWYREGRRMGEQEWLAWSQAISPRLSVPPASMQAIEIDPVADPPPT